MTDMPQEPLGDLPAERVCMHRELDGGPICGRWVPCAAHPAPRPVRVAASSPSKLDYAKSLAEAQTANAALRADVERLLREVAIAMLRVAKAEVTNTRLLALLRKVEDNLVHEERCPLIRNPIRESGPRCDCEQIDAARLLEDHRLAAHDDSDGDT